MKTNGIVHGLAPEKNQDRHAFLLIGLDVGSTTVKAVVVESSTHSVLWREYERHDTRQPEKCLEFLTRITEAFPQHAAAGLRVFATGSGAAPIASLIGAHFVQEVNAVARAIERLRPQARSAVELGGQDAKIVIFRTDPRTGVTRKFPTMNDKCAGGTGAVIDKIAAKLRISSDELCSMRYDGVKIHPVAGKCGVFAETDINSLQKQGAPPDELMASLFESIVLQNLTVLARGHTLHPPVLLLGGPNFYLRGLQECWRKHLRLLWKERGYASALTPDEDFVYVPKDAQYYAALGAAFFGMELLEDEPGAGMYAGTDALRRHIEHGRLEYKRQAGLRGLWQNPQELEGFRARYAAPVWHAPRLDTGPPMRAYLGLDGGSTSTKAVLLNDKGDVIAKAYQLSQGNPIEDAKAVLDALRQPFVAQGTSLDILAAATTGYAKDMLKDVIGADVALVETVAHARSGMHFYPEADVICDVGGQDIKIIVLKNGAVKDFRLNTQCSAGNGYYLQSTAEAFGLSVEQYADAAFSAESMPAFGYGCAVFMQTDIVDFQRQGWLPHEILAGLAAVLPKNIWLYVCQIPNLARLGQTFILQGGTQRNLAAVKAQVDFIEERFQGTGVTPHVVVHEHCGESGAIGCALEARRLYEEHAFSTSFIGFDAVHSIQYRTTRNEQTRCSFCRNTCLRTFIDVRTSAQGPEGVEIDAHLYKAGAEEEHPSRIKHGKDACGPQGDTLALAPGEQRLIIATCEKGTVENADDMRAMLEELEAVKEANPNLAEYAAREAFAPTHARLIAAPLPIGRFGEKARRRARMERRRTMRIGIPRALNLYGIAPFFMGYFQSLGVPAKHIVWSDYTSEPLYKDGAKRGSIDPCFPSKLAIPHVHNLLNVHHKRTPLTHIFLPMVSSLPTALEHTQACRACPTSTATPEAVHAAFTKEGDIFARERIAYKKTFLNLDRPDLCARQLFEDWREEIGVSEEESNRAVAEGLRALEAFREDLQARAREVLETLEEEGRVGLVLLARPYHSDPGIHHGICEEFQKLGYPILTQDSLPMDEATLERLFGQEVVEGFIASPRSISDVWKNSFSENSSRKIWAAKFVARHPNLAPLELSSFKCGHDAPIYTLIEEIIERSGKPFFCFRDIDENKPTGSIKIRIETIAYFLRRHQAHILEQRLAQTDIEERLRAYEEQMRLALSTGQNTRAFAAR